MLVPLTKKNLEEGRNPVSGWSKKQLSVLGVSWPPKKDWMDGLLGREFHDSEIDAFLDLSAHKITTKAPRVDIVDDVTQMASKERPFKKRRIRAQRKWHSGSMKADKWAERRRADLMSKNNPSEVHVDDILRRMGVRYRREASIFVAGNQYFMDFFITSIPPSRERIRICIEVDGGYHRSPQQIAADKIREKNILSYGRVKAIVRLTDKYALGLDEAGMRWVIGKAARGRVMRFG